MKYYRSTLCLPNMQRHHQAVIHTKTPVEFGPHESDSKLRRLHQYYTAGVCCSRCSIKVDCPLCEYKFQAPVRGLQVFTATRVPLLPPYPTTTHWQHSPHSVILPTD